MSQSTSTESTPRLSEDQAFNLCYTSLTYWWYEAGILSQTLIKERQKIAAYEKITGIQATSIEDLYDISEIREAQRAEMETNVNALTKELKKANRRGNLWKVGTFVLAPTALIGGVLIGVRYSR